MFLAVFTLEENSHAHVTLVFVRGIDAALFVEKEDFVLALSRCQRSAGWKKNPVAVFEEAAAAMKKQEEAAAQKKALEEAAAAKKKQEEAAAAKKKQDEAAAGQKKAQEEAAAAKKKQEEAAAAQALAQCKVRF